MSEEKLSDEQLNWWVYEHVIGAKWYVFSEKAKENHEHLRNENGRFLQLPIRFQLGFLTEASGTEDIDEKEMQMLLIPNYCSDISHAWQVVEKLKERKCSFQLITPIAKSGKYVAKVIQFGGLRSFEKPVIEVAAKSMSRAICEAAKKILEKK